MKSISGIRKRLNSLEIRSDEEEIMDSSSSEIEQLHKTLDNFRYINLFLSRSRFLIKRFILNDLRKSAENKPLSFLDIGAGGCDLPQWISSYCRKSEIPVSILCIDNNPEVISYAKDHCHDKQIEIICSDAFEVLENQRFDFITATHVLHHFSTPQASKLVKLINKAADRAFLINDLFRSRFNYVSYSFISLPFSHKSYIHHDGKLSIRKGFTRGEFQSLFKTIEKSSVLKSATIFPGHIYCTAKKKTSKT
ncbi:type 11 methyltransferase [Chitinispirillum alkaliphilum]|nr:type 11 methyltransferase [Chitinispirillum alkaliphilum]